jgi:hypothetical protein
MPRAALARRASLFAAAASLLSTSAAFASHVPIGAFDVVPDGETSDSQALVGDLLAEKEVPFAIEDATTGKTLLAGTVQQRVIMEAEKQSITFHYLVTKTPTAEGAENVFRMSAFSVGEFAYTDVNYLIDDAAAGKPSRVGRTDNAVDLNFDGTDGALPNGGAISFFIRTNATTFDESGFIALDALAPEPDPITGSVVRTGVTQNLYRAIVLPTPSAIPLPAAVYSGIIGLGTVAWLKRRKA